MAREPFMPPKAGDTRVQSLLGTSEGSALTDINTDVRDALATSLGISPTSDIQIDDAWHRWAIANGVDPSGTDDTIDFGGGGGAGSDEFYDLTLAQLEFEGTGGATATTDDAWLTSNDWTFNGTAQLDTADKKIGTASLLLDGNSDYISTPDHADWELGDGDFTIEAWVMFTNTPSSSQQVIIGKAASSNNSWALEWYNGDLRLVGSTTGATMSPLLAKVTWAVSPTAGQWYHVAFCRNATQAYGFIDGVGGTAQAFSGTLYNGTASVKIGSRVGTNFFWDGQIDHLKVTKGRAKWSAQDVFTPSAEAYATTQAADPPAALYANTVWILDFEQGETDAPTDFSTRSTTMLRTNGTMDTDVQNFGAKSHNRTGGISQGYSENDVAAKNRLGSKEFCLEAWIRLDDETLRHTLASNWHSGSNRSWVWYIDAQLGMKFVYSTGGAAITDTLNAAWEPLPDVWYHVAITREGDTLRMFVDGTQIGIDEDLGVGTVFYASTRQKHLGFSNASIPNFKGYMDEFRWTMDEPVYTTDFSRPHAGFPQS